MIITSRSPPQAGGRHADVGRLGRLRGRGAAAAARRPIAASWVLFVGASALPAAAFALLVAASVLLAACSPPASVPTSTRKGFIAVVGAGRDDPLWPVLRGSALRHQGLVGDTPLRVEAPPTISSHAQMQLIRKLRDEGMRGLCVQVRDAEAISPYLKRLANDGAVVVTMVHAVADRPSLMHCGVDQLLVGEALADAIAETVRETGTIAVLHANSTLGYALVRYQAFRERLKRYPRLTVLREFDCGGNAQRAQRMMRRCMERFPRLNGWVAIGNWPLRGLDPQEPLLPRSCKLVTTDPNPKLWEHLANGTCSVMIAADYDRIAQQAVLNCATALEGGLVAWPTFRGKPRPVWKSSLHTYKIEWMEWCYRPPRSGR